MKSRFTRIIEILFGILLVMFGLNALFAFLPIPEKEGFALEYLSILHQSGYLFPMIAAIMTSSGLLLLTNRAVAFALLIQMPISVNIFAFHLFHDWQGLIAAYVIFGMNNFLIFKRYKQYRPLFSKEVIT